MIDRIDQVVGNIRAAALINSYAERLRNLDLLPDRAALNVACSALASGMIYALASPGQIWQKIAPGEHRDPIRVEIAELDTDARAGRYAKCKLPCGIILTIPLDRLDAEYTLVEWPESTPA